MPDLQPLVFEPYRLDLSREQLWRDREVIPLTNKAFAVLRYLVEHAEQLGFRLVSSAWSQLQALHHSRTHQSIDERKRESRQPSLPL